MKKVVAFLGVIVLIAVVAFVAVAKSGEHGITTVALSEGEISFDWLVEPKMNRITYPWNDINNPGENLIAVQEKEGGSWDLINLSGEVLLKDFYQVERIVLSGDNATKVFVIKDNAGKERFATMSGDILAEPLKSRIERTSLPGFSEITTYVYSSDQIVKGKSPAKTYNLMDHEGNKVFKEDFSSYVIPLSNDRFIHKSGDKYGIIDRNLNVIVKHEYPEARNIAVDRVAFRKNTALPGWNKNESEQDYMRRVLKSFRFGLFDSDGNLILPMEYSAIDIESDGLLSIEKNGEVAFVDINGNIKIPFAKRVNLQPGFSDGIFVLFSNKLPVLSKIKFFSTLMMHPIVAAMYTTTVIDKQGNALFTINGSPFGYVRNGFFIIDKGIMGGYGLVSSSGHFYPFPKKLAEDGLIPVTYDGAEMKVIRPKKGELNGVGASYGILKFTIKEK